jgi:threonine synthase
VLVQIAAAQRLRVAGSIYRASSSLMRCDIAPLMAAAGTLASAATGILDDETYDWWEAAKGMRETGGGVLVVEEDAIARAYTLSKVHTGISTSTTGAAGLAGLLTTAARKDSAAVVFTGRDL